MLDFIQIVSVSGDVAKKEHDTENKKKLIL